MRAWRLPEEACPHARRQLPGRIFHCGARDSRKFALYLRKYVSSRSPQRVSQTGPFSNELGFSVACYRDQAWLTRESPLQAALSRHMDALARPGQRYGGVFYLDGWPDKVVSVSKDRLGRVVVSHPALGRSEHRVQEFSRTAGIYHYKGFTGRATLGKAGCVVKLSWAKKTGDTWKRKECWCTKACKNLRAKQMRELGSDVD